MKFATKPILHCPPHLRHCYCTILGNKKSNFSRYLADMDENANKVHFKCTDFNFSMRVTVYVECIYVLAEYLKYQTFKGVVIFFGKMWVALKRAGCFVVAFGGYVNCAFVPQLFQLLTPCVVQLFSGNSSVDLFAVYILKYKLFIKILSSSLNTMLFVDKHCSDVCSDEFLVPQIDHNSK